MQMQPTVSLFHKANQNKCLKQSSMFKMQIQALLQLLLLSHNQLKHAEILKFDLFWREMQGGGVLQWMMIKFANVSQMQVMNKARFTIRKEFC